MSNNNTCSCLPPFKVFAGSNSEYMAKEICQQLGVELGKMNIIHFADGEFEVCFEEPIRGMDVFLVQSTFAPSDNLMELLMMVDAAKRASAGSIIAVLPYFGWARQDRKDKPRVSIAAKLVANLLTVAGVDRIITMDLHADQIQGFFDVPLDHLYASNVFIPYIQGLKLEDLVIATPDVGGAKRANSYAKYLDVPLVLCHKQRAKANVVENMTVIGDVKDKNVIIVDDMVDTAGTITKAAQLMMDNGAKSVRALCSHAVMSDPATERVNASPLTEIIFTNSIPYTKDCPKATILSVASLFADTIKRVHANESISSQYLIK
jgi:ribose-phosphate pyrophosphokinase